MGMYNLFEDSFFKDENVLEQYKVNQSIKKVMIPTFEIIFNDETGFGAYRVEDEDGNEFSIKGTFIAPLTVGQTYLAEGFITTYRNEKQIHVNQIRNVKPVNKKGIIAYLQTLKGLKSKASWIYDEFGDKSIDVLMKDPLLVANRVKGIGKKSVLSWQEQLDKMKDTQQVMSTLLGYGLTPHQAKGLYDKYGEEIVGKIEENPYFLSSEVRGYGFERCDRIARTMGYNPKSPFRIQEGIIHVLNQASQEGHCFLPLDKLMEEVTNLLTIRLTIQEMAQFAVEKRGQKNFEYSIGEHVYSINYQELVGQYELLKKEKYARNRENLRYIVVSFEFDEIAKEVEVVSLERRIIYDDGNIYLTHLYYDELQVAKRVVELAVETPFLKPIKLERELDQYLKQKGFVLEAKQREAVLTFSEMQGGFYALCGSAGCGKTFTLKIILAMLEKQYRANGKSIDIRVYAPTGKASKVASRSTERECMTVHRGLGYHPALGFTFNEDEPLDADVVVVDESSMLDITLTKYLLNAIANGTKVIFMGDVKQLPSVGPGNVLKDLINSGIVKIVTLDVVKRQGALSGIIRNANKIIKDEMIQSCEDTKDAYVLNRYSPESTQKAIIDSMKRILTFEGYSIEDVQVLCPQRTGVIGTYAMNLVIQQTFNPEEEGMKVLNKKFQLGTDTFLLYFKKGDKVIHIKNNYDKEWYEKGHFADYVRNESIVGITNGECGIIEDIVEVKKKGDKFTRIIVRYEDKYVFYDDSFDELDHSWALTIHKSQGSQWKAVIMPIMKQNYLMLDNNLFYTGYTRAELFNCVIGQADAIRHAIKTHKTRNRYTALTDKIKKKLDEAV